MCKGTFPSQPTEVKLQDSRDLNLPHSTVWCFHESDYFWKHASCIYSIRRQKNECYKTFPVLFNSYRLSSVAAQSVFYEKLPY